MAATPNFNVEGLQFRVATPDQIGPDQWYGIQGLAFQAFSAGLEGWTQGEVAAFVRHSDPSYYRESRLDPRVAQKRGDLGPDQIWRDPVIVLAYDADQPVGYTSTWNNTSRSLKQLKMIASPKHAVPVIGGKKYVWFREMVTHPDLWALAANERSISGVAHVMGYLALERRHIEQPVAVYPLADANRMMGILRSVGFSERPKGASQQEIAGAGSRKVDRYRMIAKVGFLMSRIIQMPGAFEAVRQARESFVD